MHKNDSCTQPFLVTVFHVFFWQFCGHVDYAYSDKFEYDIFITIYTVYVIIK